MARSVRGFIAILVVFAALAVGGSAGAIVGGSADTTHTYVGAATQSQVHNGVPGTQLCTGALISPTVFLTAAHCFPGGSTATVTFASNFRTPDVTYSGTVNDSSDADVAVIVFESPITDVGLAQLPALGFDDTLPNNQLVDVVGYGVEAFDHQVPISTSAGPRQVATTAVKSAGNMKDQLLKLLADPGACFGDSGGPNLVSGSNIIVAITSSGNANCKGVSSALRVDTPVVRGFLEDYVSLP
jgi:secreted trypsin-like serine protease